MGDRAVAATKSDVTDRDGALLALESARPQLGKVRKVLCDGGYTGDKFAGAVQGLLGRKAKVEVAKRSELLKFN